MLSNFKIQCTLPPFTFIIHPPLEAAATPPPIHCTREVYPVYLSTGSVLVQVLLWLLRYATWGSMNIEVSFQIVWCIAFGVSPIHSLIRPSNSALPQMKQSRPQARCGKQHKVAAVNYAMHITEEEEARD